MTDAAVNHINTTLTPPPFQNHAIHFATQANTSEAARLDAGFQEDFVKVLAGNCIYLKNFLGKENDRTIMNGLVQDLIRAKAISNNKNGEEEGDSDDQKNNKECIIPDDNDPFAQIKKATKVDERPPPKKRYGGDDDDDDNNVKKSQHQQQQQKVGPKTKNQHEGDEARIGLQNWAQHQMFNSADKVSPVFNALVDFLSNYFDTDIHASRLNYYADNKKSWKQYHHDSHAYSKKHNCREDITIGLSFGHSRALSFLHEPTNRKFAVPQANCDLFAFTSEVNDVFMHGVPKDTCSPISEIPRLSLIVWGKRRNLTERNGGAASIPKSLMDKLSMFATTKEQVEEQRQVIRISSSSNNNNNNNTTNNKSNKNNNNNRQQQQESSKSLASSNNTNKVTSHQNDDGTLTDEAKNCVIEVAKSLVSSSLEGMGRKQTSTSSATSGGGAPAKKKKNRLQ